MKQASTSPLNTVISYLLVILIAALWIVSPILAVSLALFCAVYLVSMIVTVVKAAKNAVIWIVS